MSTRARSLAERIRDAAREIVSPGSDGERDGDSLVDEGTRVGTGFSTLPPSGSTPPMGESDADDAGIAIGAETAGYGTGPGESGSGAHRNLKEIEREAGL
jgi:hypothetical protein